MIEEHHVVLNHPEPFRLRVMARSRRSFLALEVFALLDIRCAAVESRFLVVPKNKSNRTLGLHVRAVQDARELHDQSRARSIVVGGLAPTDPFHVSPTH